MFPFTKMAFERSPYWLKTLNLVVVTDIWFFRTYDIIFYKVLIYNDEPLHFIGYISGKDSQIIQMSAVNSQHTDS